MPDAARGLGTVVEALLGLDRDLDALSIAEILWLAARGDGFSPGREAMGEDTEPQEDPRRHARTSAQPGKPDEAEHRTPLHKPWEDGVGLPGGQEVSLPRSNALPRSRDLARALKPLKRAWRHGRRQRLDIAATVADYVRGGELIPVFSAAPERWFHATVVIDRSPTMAVWTDTADELLRLLSRTGVFRTLRVRELYADSAPDSEPALHGPLGQRVVEGGGRSAHPRRLMLVLSDCASAAWRDGSQWKQLHTWAVSMPTVLFNPLPAKIWRHAGMSLPAVRVVSPGTPGVNNSQLRFTPTLLMEQAFPEAAGRDWLPVPVSSLSAHAAGSWARTLMRSDPEGCEALLLPAAGLVEQVAQQGETDEYEPPDGRSLTDAYLHRASPAAVRLAVLCSLYPQVSVDMLRIAQRKLVPEASPADLAEFVVGGLVTVTEGDHTRGHPTLRFREGAREQLRPRLGARDARRLQAALDRFIQSNADSLARFPAVAPGASGDAVVPAGHEPFAEVSAGVLRTLGLAVESTVSAAPMDVGTHAEAVEPGTGAPAGPSAFEGGPGPGHEDAPAPGPAAPRDPYADLLKATDPYADPATDPYADPATDPYADPATDPYADPATDPYADPATDPYADPATDPYGDHAPDGPEPEEPVQPPQRTPRPRAGVRPDEHPPYFFLSYARLPRAPDGSTDPDIWLERLFQDLCGHVMAMTDLPAGVPAGVMDRETSTHEERSEQLDEVLATCRVFVPLFSPRYFASEQCGKEWYAFTRRLLQEQTRNSRDSDGIVPALWVPVPPEQLPVPAERLQSVHRAYGDRYATEGLYGLIKLRTFAEEYERAVYELAKRIVREAERAAVPPGRSVDHRLLPSAFTSRVGPRRIRITVLAPTLDSLPRGRQSVFYGRTAQDWNPYHPHSLRPLAEVVGDQLRSLHYQPDIVSFDETARLSLSDRTREPPVHPELLLVDRWSLHDEDQRDWLAALDAAYLPWLSVVVAWNTDDEQSRAADRGLAGLLERTIPQMLSHGQDRSMVRAGVTRAPSLDTLLQLLPQAVETAAQQYVRHARPQLPAGGGGQPGTRGRGPVPGSPESA